MKIGKIFLAALTLLAGILLCGCGEKLPFLTKKPDFGAVSSFSAEITSGDFKAAADVTKTESGWEFAFTEPKALCGMVIEIDEKGVRGKLGSLSFSAENGAEYTVLPRIIAESVSGLSGISAENMSAKDGVITINAEFNGKNVVITADEQTGKLKTLRCPYYKLFVEFK